MANARSGFGHDTTTAEVLDGLDLSGRLAVVTGGSGGLGAETARALASAGARLVITARDLTKAQTVADAIQDATGGATVEVEEMELGSLASVRACAERILARHDAIQLLINNAGVMACPLAHTGDGFEQQFGANHLGHFLFTGLLAPALVRGAPARVVSVSSRGHQMSPVVFDDIAFERRPYEKWEAYGQSKTANILLAVELERRLGGRGVHANAVHPGVILTDLGRHLEAADMEYLQKRAPAGGLQFKTVESGAATAVYTATAPELEGRGGLYLEDCHVAPVDDAEGAAGGVRSYALDPANAQRLWAVSEQLVGQRFPL